MDLLWDSDVPDHPNDSSARSETKETVPRSLLGDEVVAGGKETNTGINWTFWMKPRDLAHPLPDVWEAHLLSRGGSAHCSSGASSEQVRASSIRAALLTHAAPQKNVQAAI